MRFLQKLLRLKRFIYSKSAISTAHKTPRCGRCSEPLPEDTSTYCSYCGATFFSRPPTTEYHLIAEHHQLAEFKKQKLLVGAFSALFILSALGIGALALDQKNREEIQSLRLFPKIVFHFYDFAEFETLSRSEKTESIYIAIQAFEDHFGLKIDDYEIKHNSLPENLIFMETGYFSKLSQFSFWDANVFEKNIYSWLHSERDHLNVMISNFPLYLSDDKQIESRHLGADLLISGLGHPSLVLASSYRLLNKLNVQSPKERSRHIGEYIIAHELGHGLLGLSDYVVGSETLMFRGPASENPIDKMCLMHTDEGGGALAWERLKKRPLGTQVPCSHYNQVLSASQLRHQAIKLAKEGKKQEAYDTLSLALSQLKASNEFSQSWVRAMWQQELEIIRPTIFD